MGGTMEEEVVDIPDGLDIQNKILETILSKFQGFHGKSNNQSHLYYILKMYLDHADKRLLSILALVVKNLTVYYSSYHTARASYKSVFKIYFNKDNPLLDMILPSSKLKLSPDALTEIMRYILIAAVAKLLHVCKQKEFVDTINAVMSDIDAATEKIKNMGIARIEALLKLIYYLNEKGNMPEKNKYIYRHTLWFLGAGHQDPWLTPPVKFRAAMRAIMQNLAVILNDEQLESESHLKKALNDGELKKLRNKLALATEAETSTSIKKEKPQKHNIKKRIEPISTEEAIQCFLKAMPFQVRANLLHELFLPRANSPYNAYKYKTISCLINLYPKLLDDRDDYYKLLMDAISSNEIPLFKYLFKIYETKNLLTSSSLKGILQRDRNHILLCHLGITRLLGALGINKFTSRLQKNISNGIVKKYDTDTEILLSVLSFLGNEEITIQKKEATAPIFKNWFVKSDKEFVIGKTTEQTVLQKRKHHDSLLKILELSSNSFVGVQQLVLRYLAGQLLLQMGSNADNLRQENNRIFDDAFFVHYCIIGIDRGVLEKYGDNPHFLSPVFNFLKDNNGTDAADAVMRCLIRHLFPDIGEILIDNEDMTVVSEIKQLQRFVSELQPSISSCNTM